MRSLSSVACILLSALVLCSNASIVAAQSYQGGLRGTTRHETVSTEYPVHSTQYPLTRSVYLFCRTESQVGLPY